MIKSKELGFTKGMTILAAEPGMGKSTMTMQLAHRLQKDPTLWVIYINLSTIESQLNAIDGIDDTDEAIAKFLLPNASYLEQKMLESRLHEKGRVSLFLDGLDEIAPPHQQKIIALLQSLKIRELQHIVVSMRDNIKEMVENALGLFSASLVPFTKKDSLDFFEKFWKKTLGLTEIDRSKVETFADKLIAIFDATTNSTGQDFIGIPLQAELLATAFSKDFEKFHKGEVSEPQLPVTLDLDDLYQRFIATKYEIFKAKLNLGENKENLEAMFNLTTKHLDKTHQLFAFNLLFPTANLTKNNIMTIRGDALVKTVGLIHSINENPDFVHRTFAEYFAAQFLVHQLNKIPVLQSYKAFLEKNIFKVRHQMVRLFMEQYINKVANSSLSEIWKAIKNNNLLPPSQGSTKVLLENSTLAVAPLSYQVAKDQLGNKFREEKQPAINEIIAVCNAILSITPSDDALAIDLFSEPFALLKEILREGQRKPEREAVHSRLKDIFWYYIQVHQRLKRTFNNQTIQDFTSVRKSSNSNKRDFLALDKDVRQTQAVIGRIYADMEENNTFSPSINLLEEIFDKNANINQREVHKARDWLTNIGVQLVKTFNILTPNMAPLFIKVALDLLKRSPTTLGKYLYSLENNLLNPLLNNINKDTKLDHSIFIDMYHKIMSFHEQYFHGTWTLTPEGMRNLLKLIKDRLETSVDKTTLSTCVSLLYLFNKVGIHLIRTETEILLLDPKTETEYPLPLLQVAHIWELIRFKVNNPILEKEFLEKCEKKAIRMNQYKPSVKTLKRTPSGTLLPF